MPQFHPVARVDEFGPGSIKTVDIGDDSVVISRVGDEFFAAENVCSHDQSPFETATMEGFEIRCPRHEGRFDVRSGAATCFPAVWPITTYEVRVVDGVVEVSLG